MLACPRVLAARSPLGLLAPPNAPEWDGCERFCACGAGRAAGCVVGLDAGCVDGLDADPFPVEGRAICELPVFGRVPPGWPKPRSADGFLAGAFPAPIRLFAPAFAPPGCVDGRPCILFPAWAFLLP